MIDKLGKPIISKEMKVATRVYKQLSDEINEFFVGGNCRIYYKC